jgi:Flp pilus assembly protein TadB
MTVSASSSNLSADARDVRDALSAGDRRRRARAAGQRIWRMAPAAAGVCLAAAALARLAGWSAIVPAGLLAAGAAALAVFAVASRRARPVSDTVGLDSAAAISVASRADRNRSASLSRTSSCRLAGIGTSSSEPG